MVEAGKAPRCANYRRAGTGRGDMAETANGCKPGPAWQERRICSNVHRICWTARLAIAICVGVITSRYSSINDFLAIIIPTTSRAPLTDRFADLTLIRMLQMSFQRAITATAFAVANFAGCRVLRPARADTVSAIDLLTKFNAVVGGNYSTTSERGAGDHRRQPHGQRHLPEQRPGELPGYGAVNVRRAGQRALQRQRPAGEDRRAMGNSNFSGAGLGRPRRRPSRRDGRHLGGGDEFLGGAIDAVADDGAASALPAANSNNVLTATPTTINGVAGVAVIDIAASLLGRIPGCR